MKRGGVVDLSPLKQIELQLRESNAYVYCADDLSICKKLSKMMIYHSIFYKSSMEKTSRGLTQWRSIGIRLMQLKLYSVYRG